MASAPHKRITPPNLKKYMDKRLKIYLNQDRIIVGQLRGFDAFMNLVVDEVVEVKSAHEKHPIGIVVVRGKSVVEIEILENFSNNSMGLAQSRGLFS